MAIGEAVIGGGHWKSGIPADKPETEDERRKQIKQAILREFGKPKYRQELCPQCGEIH